MVAENLQDSSGTVGIAIAENRQRFAKRLDPEVSLVPALAGRGDETDFRVRAFRRALAIVGDDGPDRARRVLEVLSDHSTDPIPSAAGMKGAFGACPE